MIASMDSLKQSQYTARGSLKVAVKDCGPGRGRQIMEIPCFDKSMKHVMHCLVGLTASNLKKVFSEGLQQFHEHKLVAGGGSGRELWNAKGGCSLLPPSVLLLLLGIKCSN